jgi:hypothetical protein
MARASVPSFIGDEIVAFEDVAYGASSRPRPGRLSFLEQREELLGSPRGVPLARFEDGVDDAGIRLMRTRVRSPRTVAETLGTAFLVTGDPLVAGLSTNAEPPAQLSKGEELASVVSDELSFLVHG